MVVSKIVSHAGWIVAQNKMDRVCVLGKGARSRSKRHSPPASLSDNSTKVPVTRLERQSRTAQSNRT